MDPRAGVVNAFHDVSKQLMTTLKEAWPERFQTMNVENMNEDELMKAFCTNFKHLFDRCTSHDLSIFDDPLLQSYKDLLSNTDTLNVFWQYTDHMIRFASIYTMYDGMPTGVIGVLSDSINDIRSRLESGTLDASSINPLELGQQVIAKLNPNDIQNLTQSLMGNQQQMMSLMNSMMSMLNNKE